jgi:ankyrin repeat protein
MTRDNPSDALYRLLQNAKIEPLDEVKSLLAKGAKERPCGLYRESTPLMLAVARGFEETAKALLPISRPRARDMDGNTVIISAIVNGELGCARLLAQWCPWLARQPDEYANAPVKIAAMCGNAEMVGMLMAFEVGARGGLKRLAEAAEAARDNQHDDVADWIETALLAAREKSVLGRIGTQTVEVESRGKKSL